MKSCPHILRYQIGCQSCLRFQSNTYYSDDDFLSPKNLVAWFRVGVRLRYILRLAPKMFLDQIKLNYGLGPAKSRIC